MAEQRADVIVIGAGFCGLAASASLSAQGIGNFLVLERGTEVGHFWSQTYDRIRLHSAWHGLPQDGGLNRAYPMYKSRDQLLDYFRSYARCHGVYAHARFGEAARRVEHLSPASAGHEWRIDTDGATYYARVLVVATALNRVPHVPALPGRDDYRGSVLHSAAYRNAQPFRGQRVLVVGSGNSAAEIALELAEHGATPHLWVRGPRHFVPLRKMTRLFHLFRLSGGLSATRLDAAHQLTVGTPEFAVIVRQRDRVISRYSEDLSSFGIRKPSRGPNEEAFATGRIAVFDRGAIPAIRGGRIRVIDGNAQPLVGLTGDGVQLGDVAHPFDSVILATGFVPGLEDFLVDTQLLGTVRGRSGMPLTDGRSRARLYPSAFFPGFDPAVNGGLSLGRWGWEAGEQAAAALRAPRNG